MYGGVVKVLLSIFSAVSGMRVNCWLFLLHVCIGYSFVCYKFWLWTISPGLVETTFGVLLLFFYVFIGRTEEVEWCFYLSHIFSKWHPCSWVINGWVIFHLVVVYFTVIFFCYKCFCQFVNWFIVFGSLMWEKSASLGCCNSCTRLCISWRAFTPVYICGILCAVGGEFTVSVILTPSVIVI